MKFENKRKLRNILRTVSAVKNAFSEYEMKYQLNRLYIQLGVFVDKVRMNEISEEEEE